MSVPDPTEPPRPNERRKASRRSDDLLLEVAFDAKSIAGRAEQISAEGVFFFAHEPLRVTLKLVQDGQEQSYPGRLVRVERLSEHTTGLAVEFERPS
ncbi:MAG: PilZ domain-containing protein [Planctomycetes bacterium]|nr:PilZ domain-containing protein [Planctomycetota bacterium]